MTTMPSATWYHRWLGWHAPALRQGLVVFAIGIADGLIGALFHPWQVAPSRVGTPLYRAAPDYLADHRPR
jgi:hypothetical protein